MSQIQTTLNAIMEFKNQLFLLLDSGEIPENNTIFIVPLLEELNKLDDELEQIQSKPTKKKNLITGEFSIRGGYYDFKESGKFTIEMLGGSFDFPVDGAKENLAMYLSRAFAVNQPDIFLNEWFIDTDADTLRFAFAFQTDLHFTTPKNEISLITPKKLSFGIFHQNKAYFRLPELTTLPDQIWEYPCFGFAIPYSYEGNVIDLLRRIESAAQEGGELADLRAIGGKNYEPIVNALVEILKSRKWKTIFTAFARYKLLPDGSYKKY